jgi:hypothetical protein
MRKEIKIFSLITLFSTSVSLANNPLKIGAASTQLLINPYARATGAGGFNTAIATGIEAQFLNVAGLARINKTSVLLSKANLYGSSVIGVFGAGIAQKVGETGVLGFGVIAMNPGDIPITTFDIPDNRNGTYKPQFINLNISYAKMFSDNLVGGINLKVINEQLPNLKANGIALDAGFQYTGGKKDQLHFGITLKNIGPKMRYTGEGLSSQVLNANGNSQLTISRKTAEFELPTLVSIGLAYDVYFGDDSVSRNTHKLTPFIGFNSNAYYADEFGIGFEYNFMKILAIRAAYGANNGTFNNVDGKFSEVVYSTNSGLSAGASVSWPFNAKKSSVGIDYSFQHSKVLANTHSFGLHLDF